MLRAYKYRLYPNAEQVEMFEKHFSYTRFVYNWALTLHKRYDGIFKGREGKLTHGKLMAKIQSRLVKKKKTEFSWLNDINSQSILNALQNLNQAYLRHYNGQNDEPKFKSKKHYKRTFQCPQDSKVDFTSGKLHLRKIKNIKIELSRPFHGEIKTVTISKTPTGKYFASILVDDGRELPTPSVINKDLTIGIDLGLSHFLTTSNGEKVDNPRCLKPYLTQIKVVQKILDRKERGSHNRQRQNLMIAKLHEKVKNIRLDFLHKLTSKLVCDSQATSFAVEDLGVKNLMKNHKLAQAIHDVSWGQFLNFLTYKASWHGKNVLKVDRFFASSKTCSCCGHKLDKLPLSERYWTCPQCNTFHDRDVNASINIRLQVLKTNVDGVGATPS